MWQDSLLSMSFDRSSAILDIDRRTHKAMTPEPSKLPYMDCMQALCRIGLEIVQDRCSSLTTDALSHIMETRSRLEAVMERASDHLRNVKWSRTVRDHLEHWNLEMHKSYILSELCRPILTHQKMDATRDAAVANLMGTCMAGLTGAVNAFIHLQRSTSFAKRSWAAVHRSLSSALLLCILGEAQRVETTCELVNELITVLSDLYVDLDPSEVPTPVNRSIQVLRNFVSPALQDQQLFSTPDGWTDASSLTDVGPFTSPPTTTSSFASPYSAMNRILWGTESGVSL